LLGNAGGLVPCSELKQAWLRTRLSPARWGSGTSLRSIMGGQAGSLRSPAVLVSDVSSASTRHRFLTLPVLRTDACPPAILASFGFRPPLCKKSSTPFRDGDRSRGHHACESVHAEEVCYALHEAMIRGR
jgi:hypothetical protein